MVSLEPLVVQRVLDDLGHGVGGAGEQVPLLGGGRPGARCQGLVTPPHQGGDGQGAWHCKQHRGAWGIRGLLAGTIAGLYVQWLGSWVQFLNICNQVMEWKVPLWGAYYLHMHYSLLAFERSGNSIMIS